MTPTPEQEFRLAAEPLDDLDAVLLAEIHDLHVDTDPMPGDLLDRVKFAMSVAALQAQVAEIVSGSDLASVRGTDYDRADTVTFARDGLSVMVTIEHGESTRSDVVGWVSETDVEVELRERGRTRTTTTDEDGRFAFTGVERGLASFVLRRRAEPDSPPIITPAIEL